jgi:hypothetical protein
MELVESAEEVRREVCGRCSERPTNGPRSKVPDAELSWLVDWVVATTQRLVEGPAPDGRKAMLDADSDADEQWQVLRRRLRRPPPKPGTTIRELYQAYEEVTGTSLGCD